MHQTHGVAGRLTGCLTQMPSWVKMLRPTGRPRHSTSAIMHNPLDGPGTDRKRKKEENKNKLGRPKDDRKYVTTNSKIIPGDAGAYF